jgi:hypothetical protein
MHLGNHRGNPAHVEIDAAHAAPASLALADIALHRRLPEACVRRVDGVFPGVFRDADAGMGEDEVAALAVEREGVRAGAQRQHDHRRWAIDGITGHHLLAAGTQEIAGFGIARGRPSQNGENGADRNVDVAVRRAVERVEQQQVTAARILVGNAVGRVHLLRGHARQLAAPFAVTENRLVGQDIEFLLDLALHVGAVERAMTPGEGALGDQRRDGLDGSGDVDQQGAELTMLRPRLLDDEFGKGRTSE